MLEEADAGHTSFPHVVFWMSTVFEVGHFEAMTHQAFNSCGCSSSSDWNDFLFLLISLLYYPAYFVDLSWTYRTLDKRSLAQDFCKGKHHIFGVHWKTFIGKVMMFLLTSFSYPHFSKYGSLFSLPAGRRKLFLFKIIFSLSPHRGDCKMNESRVSVFQSSGPQKNFGFLAFLELKPALEWELHNSTLQLVSCRKLGVDICYAFCSSCLSCIPFTCTVLKVTMLTCVLRWTKLNHSFS